MFAWGRADYGQLGVTFEDLPSTICTPTEVECLKGVQKVRYTYNVNSSLFMMSD